MKLNATALKSFAHGAVSVRECADGYTRFFRFSDKQMEYYKATNKEFYVKSYCTASVRLELTTDATAISFSYLAKKGASRTFYYFDLYVDGAMVAHAGKDNAEVTEEGALSLPLPAGTHRVAIYFPALYEIAVKDVVLEHATLAEPVAKQRKMLAIGDSITHGYDALYSSLSYVNITADRLDASVVNQAIGAEIFNPGLVDGDLGFTPDFITVAYGTNDYFKCTREDFIRNAHEFYARMREAFPTAKIFALLPIWRKDNDVVHAAGTFAEAKEIVRAAAAAQENVVVVDCDPFVPHLPEFFSDRFLHPNDLGFGCYASGVVSAIAPYLV